MVHKAEGYWQKHTKMEVIVLGVTKLEKVSIITRRTDINAPR